jgi:hypothetical protein
MVATSALLGARKLVTRLIKRQSKRDIDEVIVKFPRGQITLYPDRDHPDRVHVVSGKTEVDIALASLDEA